MEKPWMTNLLDTLQTPPAKNLAPEKPVAGGQAPQEPVAERSSVSAPQPDIFAGPIGSRWTNPTKETVSDRPGADAPFNFAGGTDNRWSPATKSPLDYEDWNESWSDRILSHAPAITVVVLLAVALGALSFFYRAQVGQSLVWLGQKLSGQSTLQNSIVTAPDAKAPTQPTTPPLSSLPPQSAAPQQPVTSSSAPATKPAPAADATSAANLPATDSSPSAANADAATNSPVDLPKNSGASANGSSNDTARSGSRHALAQSRAEKSMPRTSVSVDGGQADFQLADAALHQARTPAEKARAAEMLWTAVSNGSSDAEVELADAYGRGNGVRKNCQQARILLAAATDKNNPLAAKESAELRVYGCR